MKVLFIMRHALFPRNFDSVIRGLSAEGHTVHMSFTVRRNHIDDSLPEALCKECKNVSFDYTPKIKHTWGKKIDLVRDLRNLIRYFDPCFKKSDSLKARAERRMPEFWLKLFSRMSPSTRTRIQKPFDKILSFIDDCSPIPKEAIKFIESKKPDLLLISPLYDLNSKNIDFAKAGRSLGIPTCCNVASWDNLTNKGIIQGKPDFVTVWNDLQKKEAIELHNIKKSRIYTTGAQIFDEWFERKATVSRDEFCEKLSLSNSKKIITYLCSSVFISRNEVDFVCEWAAGIRSSGNKAVKDANILVRPHPTSGKEFWKELDPRLAKIPNLTVWPLGGELPGDQFSKDSYFNTLYYSDAVMGVNTSAFIEAGIVKTPCFTIEDEHFSSTQDGTVHFHYLTNGKLVKSAGNIGTHISQLEEALERPEPFIAAGNKFTKSFVRPHGMDTAATDVFLKALTVDIPKRFNEINQEQKKENKFSHRIGAYLIPRLLSIKST